MSDYLMMKTNNHILTGAVFLGLILSSANITFAQTEVKETTTTVTSAGTISEFGPETIIVRSETSPEPLRYIYSKTTTYVDETGAPVSIETVKSGLPVTVFYTKVGDKMMASKVIVRKSVAKAVTSIGTITEFGPETIIVHSETSPEPLRYIYSKATNYVDEDGTPVLVGTVKSGLPVTVYYVKDGDKMMATKVVVRKLPAKVLVPVIEEKKTTTTTTSGK